MDAYYSALFAAADLKAYVKPLRAAVKTAVSKNKKRLADATAKLDESSTADNDRMIGDLLTANIYKIKRGDKSVTVDNFFDENGGEITIALDVTKNAQQNAAAHYKAYNKKKKAVIYAQDAIEKAQAALYVLDGISAELDLCTEKRELDEVRSELVALGLIKPENKRKKDKPVPSEPYSFDIDGAQLLVGKKPRAERQDYARRATRRHMVARKRCARIARRFKNALAHRGANSSRGGNCRVLFAVARVRKRRRRLHAYKTRISARRRQGRLQRIQDGIRHAQELNLFIATALSALFFKLNIYIAVARRYR